MYTALAIRNFLASVIKSASSDKNLGRVTFCIVSKMVAYKLNFLSKQTGTCLTKTATDLHFGNMKFKWKKMDLIHRKSYLNVFLFLFRGKKDKLLSV